MVELNDINNLLAVLDFALCGSAFLFLMCVLLSLDPLCLFPYAKINEWCC